MSSYLYGIAGGTCSGKSTLLRNLQTQFPDSIATLSFDEYFIGSDLYDLNDITNFEDPSLYDFPVFLEDLKKLKADKALEIRSNSRESSKAGITKKTIEARPITIIEGFLIFHHPDCYALFDKTAFISLSNSEILKRRYSRSEGSKHWYSPTYIKTKIIPYHHIYVEPQRNLVQTILDGHLSPDELTNQAIEFFNLS